MDKVKSWFQENLGKHIRRQRQAMNLTKEELSLRTGLDSKHIGKLERGVKLPNSLSLMKIQVALNLDLNELQSEFKDMFFEDDIYKF